MKKLKRYRRLLIAGAGILLVLLVLIFGFRGCGVSHKSPEGVVKSLIKAYGKGSQSKIRSCYGVKKADEDLQKEIDATISYIEVHNTKEVEIEECDVLSENKDYTYVYITYHLIQEDKQEYPCISTYMTEKKDGKYYVISTANVTDEMRQEAAEDYKKFMTTNIYKNYVREYDTFTKKNPGYEEKIAGKLS